MKARIRRTLIAGTSLLFACTATLTALAACGSGKKAKLSLSAGDGGALSKTEYSVKVGTNLSSYLKDKVPTVTVQGITFACWFSGTQQLAADAVMPETGLTLTAKYYAPYTLNVYTWDEQTSAYGAAATTQGNAFWHEPFDVLSAYTMPEGYVADDTKANDSSTKSLDVGKTFTLYVKPGELYLDFRANAPAGVSIDGKMNTGVAHFGGTFTIPASTFTSPAEYRQTGWATSADGPVVYHEGDTFKAEKDVTLYAVWEKGKTDIFGGDDYLFFTDKEDEIWLRRVGLGDRKGTFDAATSSFTFKDGEKTVLEGKIVDECFYYFRDLQGKTFRYSGETNETLVFGEKGAATYTVTPQGGQAVSKQGFYTADPVTGDYIFESGDTKFYFTLSVENSGSQPAYGFVRGVEGKGEERGFYALYIDGEEYDAMQAVQLDGIYDANGFASAGLYQFRNGKYVRQVTTYYGLEDVIIDDEEAAAAAERPTTYALLNSGDEYTLFRLESKQFTENGRQFSGIFRAEDSYRGSFPNYDDIMAGTTSLTLDGFGGATYLEEPAEGSDGETQLVEATYTIEKLEAHGVSIEYIAMKTPDKTLYIQFDNFNGLPYFLTSDAQPKLVDIAHSLKKTYGIYEGGEGGLQNLYDGGFLYFFNDIVVEVYSYFTDTFDGISQHSGGIDYGNAAAKADEEGVYTFESSLAGGKVLFEFRFTEDGKVEMTLPYMQTIAAGTGEEALTVDKWGTLNYGGQTYAYGGYTVNEIFDDDYADEEGKGYVLREYIFGGTTVTLRAETAAEEGNLTYTGKNELVGEGDLLELVLKQYPGQDDQFDRIYFIEGLPADATPKAAGILLFVSDGSGNFSEAVLLHGELTYDTTKAIYTLSLDRPANEKLNEFFGTYNGITFKIADFNGKTAAVTDDGFSIYDVTAEDGSKLEFGGFGTATYTPAEGKGEAFTGAYDFLATDGDNKTLVRITGTDGEEKHFLLTLSQDGDAATDFTLVTAPEAGYYAYMSSDYMVSFSDYIVFFGAEQGKAGVYYETYLSRTNEVVEHNGTYRATGEKIAIGNLTFTEYALTYTDEKDVEQTTYICTNEIPLQNDLGEEGGEMHVFMERVWPIVTYTVKEGGEIFSNGYDIPTYTDAKGNIFYGTFGRENLNDKSPKQSDYNVDEEDHSKDGKQLFFYASYIELSGILYDLPEEQHFLFDVIEEDEEISLTLRGNLSGTFALFEKGDINEKVLLYFDGHGNASLKKDTAAEVTGTYTYDEEENLGVFTPATGKGFTFGIYSLDMDGDRWYLFVDTAEENLYLNEDWSLLSLEALGSYTDGRNILSGVYTDHYGDSHYGIYEYFTETLLAFGNTEEMFYFRLNEATKTFTLIEDEFIVEDGILYAYTGPMVRTDGLTIPDGVTTIGEGVFAYMTIRGKIDFNDVEIIGARAFYESNMSSDNDQTLSSMKVTEIGDEAFYTTFVTDGPMNAISNLNFPALKKIGARAFYNCNQMRTGTIVLRDIVSIGEQAFMHIVNPGSGTMVLDLTAVPDLSKLTIADTAFEDISKGDHNPDQLPPVKILLGFTDLTKIEGWKKEFKDWTQVASFMSADAVTYLDFNKEGATRYTYAYGWRAAEEKAYTWTLDGTEVKLADGEGTQALTFAADAATFVLDGTTYYRTYVTHTLTVNESEGDAHKDVELKFSFTAEVGGTPASPEITSTPVYVAYGGRPSGYIYDWSAYTDGILVFDMPENATDIYRIEVDLSAKTSTRKLGERILFSQGETYRAVFEDFSADGIPARLSAFGEIGTLYRNVVSKSVQGTNGVFRFDAVSTQDGKRITTSYTVTYQKGDTPSFTVTSTSKEMYTVYMEIENEFRATFLNSEKDATVMEQLFEFAIYDADNKTFQTILGEGYFIATVKNGTEANTFIVTVNSGTTIYTVKYVPAEGGKEAHIEVDVTTLTPKSVDTDHEGNQEYYKVYFYVDQNGKPIGLQKIENWVYEAYFEAYHLDFTTDATDVTMTESDNTVTFTFVNGVMLYTVVVTTTEVEGTTTYTATVGMGYAS